MVDLVFSIRTPQESDGSGGSHCSSRSDAAPGIGKEYDPVFPRSFSLRERIGDSEVVLWSFVFFKS